MSEKRMLRRTCVNVKIDNVKIDNVKIDNVKIDNVKIDNVKIDNDGEISAFLLYWTV